jgi:archaellum component FlaD/FlaE
LRSLLKIYYTLKNTKSLIDFKKIFNKAKLNAPDAEEFVSECQLEPQSQQEQQEQQEQQHQQEVQSEMRNQQSNCSNVSMSTADSQSQPGSPKKKNNKKANFKSKKQRTPEPQIDYEKLELLNGPPRADDYLAFQVFFLDLTKFFFLIP